MKDIGAGVKLTTSEKERMRSNLLEYMAHTPLRVSPSAKSTRMRVYFFSHRLTATFAILALLFTSGVGISFASNDALPGEALYAVKETKEDLALYLASNDVEKAEYAIERVQKRFQEVEALAAEGNLTEKTEEFLTKKIQEQKTEAETYIAMLGETDTPEAEALRFAFAVSVEERVGVLRTQSDDAHIRIAQAIGGEVHMGEEEEMDTMATLALAPAPEVATFATTIEHSEEPQPTSRTMMAMKAPDATPESRESDVQRDLKESTTITNDGAAIIPMELSVMSDIAETNTNSKVSIEVVQALQRVLSKEVKKLASLDAGNENQQNLLHSTLEQSKQSQKEITLFIGQGEYENAKKQIEEELRSLYRVEAQLSTRFEIN